MPQTSREGVVVIKNAEGELTNIIYKDLKSRKNIFYSCTEMSLEELEAMVGADTVKV